MADEKLEKPVIGPAVAVAGDEIVVFQGKKKVKLTLFGVEGPKKAPIMGFMARNQLDSILLADKKGVQCQLQQRESGEKTYAICTNAQGEIALNLINAGWGFANRQSLQIDNFRPYLRAENTARKQKLGFWADSWRNKDGLPSENDDNDEY